MKRLNCCFSAFSLAVPLLLPSLELSENQSMCFRFSFFIIFAWFPRFYLGPLNIPFAIIVQLFALTNIVMDLLLSIKPSLILSYIYISSWNTIINTS